MVVIFEIAIITNSTYIDLIRHGKRGHLQTKTFLVKMMNNGQWDDGNHRTDRHSQSKKEHKVLNRYLEIFLLNLDFAFNFQRGLKQVGGFSQTQAWALMYLLIKTMLIFRAHFLLPFIAKPILKVQTQHSATKVLEDVIENDSTKFSHSDILAWMIGHRKVFNASVTWLAELKNY